MVCVPDHMPNKNQLPILDSELYGKKLRDKKTGKLSDVELVWAERIEGNQWFIGVMTSVEVETQHGPSRSHGILWWQNISITDVNYLHMIQFNKDNFEVVTPDAG